MRMGGSTSQFDLPSLTPLSVAGCGRLQLGVPHWAASVDYCQQLIIDPTFYGSRFSTGRILAIEDCRLLYTNGITVRRYWSAGYMGLCLSNVIIYTIFLLPLNTHFDNTTRNYNICLYDASNVVKGTTNFMPILYCSSHFSALPTLYTPHSFCVPHPFHNLRYVKQSTSSNGSPFSLAFIRPPYPYLEHIIT